MRPMRAILMLLLAGVLSSAGDGPLDRATLRGLKAIGVVIDPLDAELEREGLSGEALQTQVEQRLQAAGIPIDKNAVEFVGLKIMGAQAKRTPVALCLDLGLYQPVILSRDKEIRTATETWGTHSVLLAQPRQVSQSSAETVDQLVQQFVDAYRSANPK